MVLVKTTNTGLVGGGTYTTPKKEEVSYESLDTTYMSLYLRTERYRNKQTWLGATKLVGM